MFALHQRLCPPKGVKSSIVIAAYQKLAELAREQDRPKCEIGVESN